MQVVDYDCVLPDQPEPLQGLQCNDDCVASIDNTNDVTTYHRDRQMNTIALTNASGGVINLASYTPYGDFDVVDAVGTTVDPTTTTVDNEYWYTGRRLDKESGLWYFRARYFDSQLGTFVSRDPLGYVDGYGLYNGFFATSLKIDPFGLANDGSDGYNIADAIAIWRFLEEAVLPLLDWAPGYDTPHSLLKHYMSGKGGNFSLSDEDMEGIFDNDDFNKRIRNELCQMIEAKKAGIKGKTDLVLVMPSYSVFRFENNNELALFMSFYDLEYKIGFTGTVEESSNCCYEYEGRLNLRVKDYYGFSEGSNDKRNALKSLFRKVLGDNANKYWPGDFFDEGALRWLEENTTVVKPFSVIGNKTFDISGECCPHKSGGKLKDGHPGDYDNAYTTN